ncbi:hypothetical protein [Flavobacterium sp. 245]|uniref:hypothetical protein n=1 Tax=Flavobacterium sp. 245 TaxID=2512115 RepID=UPI00105CFA58|nr:hypothetical protein [Flavobacterium sp. 245]TDP03920.1 hypothetical protein EV145_101314 [Flavobacterium sp. 245]
MIKKILNLEHAQKISKNEQKTIKGIPECWVQAIEAGCILIPAGGVCPMDTLPGICSSGRLCC